MQKEKLKKKDVRNEPGDIVASISVKSDVLHGPCEWYDSRGNLVAYGFFKDGKPFSGTFLNWSAFYPHASEDPYNSKDYSNDWISDFEATFFSQLPDYTKVIEVYQARKKLTLKHK